MRDAGTTKTKGTCMYDFTTRVDRRGTGSSKWDAMLRSCPDVPEGVVPLSTADM